MQNVEFKINFSAFSPSTSALILIRGENYELFFNRRSDRLNNFFRD